MTRTKAKLGPGARLSDYLSASLLPRAYSPELIHRSLDEHGANSLRVRRLPAVATVYYCMALSLYPEAAYEDVYEDVFSVVVQGLSWMQGNPSADTVTKSSISAARSRLGFEPLKALHEHVCLPLADPHRQPHAFYAGLRLVAIDGSNFEIPDETANAAVFGYLGSRNGHAATLGLGVLFWWSAQRRPSSGPTSGFTAPPSGRSASHCCHDSRRRCCVLIRRFLLAVLH